MHTKKISAHDIRWFANLRSEDVSLVSAYASCIRHCPPKG
jgi:hypothetical protein